MQAENDQNLPESADQDAANDAADHRNAVDGVEDQGQDAAQDACDGADDQIGQRDHDDQSGKGNHEQFDDVGDHFLQPALQRRSNGNGQNDGHDRAGVAGCRHDDGDAEEGLVIAHLKGSAAEHGAQHLACGAVDHVGVAQGDADGHADEFIHLELLGGRVAQDDGQEVEEAVCHSVPHLIGAGSGGDQADEVEQSQQALDDAGSGQHAQSGLQGTGDHVDQHGNGALLAAALTAAVVHSVAVLIHSTGCVQMAHFQHSVIHIVDLIADDHLILSACLHDLDHAVGGLQNFLVCLALVLQLEAQTGDAVRHGDDVALAANILDNNARKAVVFTCHKPVLLFTLFVCLFGQFKAQPPVA